MIRVYSIEVDGHFHGGPAPRPWVARIDGTDERYGLRREFIRPLNDYRNAHAAWSGNVYGLVARFPLHSGHLYEVSRTRGKSSKLRVVREFYHLDDELKMCRRTPEEALAVAEGETGDEAITVFRSSDVDSSAAWVAEVTGIGTPRRLGWVVVHGERLYRLRPGHVYEIQEDGARRLVRAQEDRMTTITEADALARIGARSAA